MSERPLPGDKTGYFVNPGDGSVDQWIEDRPRIDAFRDTLYQAARDLREGVISTADFYEQILGDRSPIGARITSVIRPYGAIFMRTGRTTDGELFVGQEGIPKGSPYYRPRISVLVGLSEDGNALTIGEGIVTYLDENGLPDESRNGEIPASQDGERLDFNKYGGFLLAYLLAVQPPRPRNLGD